MTGPVPKPLGPKALARALEGLRAWELAERKLHREYRFAGFREAFAFMTAGALTAEAMQHHPEWRNVHRTVEVWLTTHDAGGITERDVALARELDRCAGLSGSGAGPTRRTRR
jgi:4a-hydroxytetrahydrobiopterin dehydratase